jgi:hypothetical protein
MTTDSDLSALLPNPPPPRPAARAAALAEALSRFDGQGAAPAKSSAPPRARPGWARPQLAAFASALLVVLVSVPIWWAERDRLRPPSPEREVAAKGVSPESERSAPETEGAESLPTAAQPADAELIARSVTAPAETPAAAAAAAKAAAPPAEAVGAAAEASAGTVPALRAPPPPPPPPPTPPPPVAQRARQATADTAADAADTDVVVTGSRVERGYAEARAPIASFADAAPLDGEWNACTLRDPRRNPTRCRASAQVSEGLALAWQGDLDRAIRAFDRAVAAEPDSALAYLNRGLAWQQKGDLARALADLNRAVARDRTGARAYYHRSQLYRARGEEVRAAADAERALELDPDYAEVLR